MPSKKFMRLENEIYSFGMRAHMLVARKARFSNGLRYEMSVYFLNPKETGKTITSELRETIVRMADGVGLYVKFFAKDEFEEVARRAVWKDDSIENGIVAVFLPKYPFSRVKKIMREIKENYRKSFDYFQEDEAVLDEIFRAEGLEKLVLCISRKEQTFPVYAGDVSDSLLYLTKQKLNDYQSMSKTLLKEQYDDIKGLCFLLKIK